MRELVGAIFWALSGGLIAFGFLGLMSIGLPFLVIGAVMGILGVFWPGIGSAWAITTGLAGVPMYLVLRRVSEAIGASGPPCAREGAVTIAAPPGAGESTVLSCSPDVPENYVAVLAFLGVIALSGPVVRLVLLPRGRPS